MALTSSTAALSAFRQELVEMEFARLPESPTYRALPSYRLGVWLEETCRTLYGLPPLMFREGHRLDRPGQSREWKKRMACFRELATSGQVTAREWDAFIPRAISTTMESEGLIRRDEGLVLLKWRPVPASSELVVFADPFSQTRKDSVHIGLDSMVFMEQIRQFLNRWRPAPRSQVLDLGCGSGIHSLGMARILPDACFTLTDVNPRAIDLARMNAALEGVEARCHFKEEDWSGGGAGHAYDIIVCNPPWGFGTIACDAGQLAEDGGGLWGLRQTVEVLHYCAQSLRSDGRALILTQTPARDGQHLFLEDALRKNPVPGMNLHIRCLYCHLLAEPGTVRQLDTQGWQCLALVLVEASIADSSPWLTVEDGRPWFKRLSDGYRVRGVRSTVLRASSPGGASCEAGGGRGL